ncbi:MAG: hypothetical protein ACRDS1_00735 [Pseudonocardiaceae bacterium]
MRETAVEAFFDAWTEAVDREAVPSDEERRIDGDLLEQVVLNACPGWMTDEAAKELAERVLAGCADTGYFVVLRGPDSKPWTPDQPVARSVVEAP